MCAAVAQYLVRGKFRNRAYSDHMSAHPMYSMCRLGEPGESHSRVLSCISIDSDAVTVPPRLGGDFSGEEKMPEIGSKPCSSYTPRSASVMPVFLRTSATCAFASRCFSYLPCTPTS
jgi:hypothetical protein